MIKKIDLHCYVTAFPQYAAPHKDGGRFMSAQEQIAFQDKLNIDYGVIVPILSPEGQWMKLGSENCKHITVQYPDRFTWFCGIDPRMGRFQDNTDFTPLLEFFTAAGAKGVGEIAPSIYVDDAMTDNLFSWCEKYEMPALVRYTHYYGSGSGIYDDKGLRRTENMLNAHPKLHFIGSYEGLWAEYPTVLPHLMERCSNMHCVISGKAAAEALMDNGDTAARFLECFSNRIYYGTAAYSDRESYPFELDAFLTELVKSGKLTETAYERIVRYNAEKLLNR